MSVTYRDALRKGTRIGDYEIHRVLGQGGFGITYLAYDHNLDGPVALKEYFPAEIARRRRDGAVAPNSRDNRNVFDWGLKRFLAEAQTIHRLRHPNIVRLLRYFEARGGAFIVMEYLEGDSLAEVLKKRGRLEFAEWRPVLERLLDGLEHVHARDYLHRDIKPANIIIRAADDAPVLIDFGSARIATGERTHTQVFTREYAPIEQHGKGQQHPPADLYALAAVSYRVLLGELPPMAPDRVLEDTIKRLEQSVRGAERGWLAGLDRCLAVQPNDRPQSVAALRQEFTKGFVAPESEAVRNYRRRFTVPKSGRGRALVKRLGPPLDDWWVRRWVGHRSSGEVNATVFAPFHGRSGRDAGDAPLFAKRFDELDEGYAWLLRLENSGAIEEAARERIPGRRGLSTPSKPPPASPLQRPPRVSPAPPDPLEPDDDLDDDELLEAEFGPPADHSNPSTSPASPDKPPRPVSPPPASPDGPKAAQTDPDPLWKQPGCFLPLGAALVILTISMAETC